jgi:hypothetical protein
MESVIAVQIELLRQIGFDHEKVKWFLKTLHNRHLKANFEIEYTTQYTAKKRMYH